MSRLLKGAVHLVKLYTLIVYYKQEIKNYGKSKEMDFIHISLCLPS